MYINAVFKEERAQRTIPRARGEKIEADTKHLLELDFLAAYRADWKCWFSREIRPSCVEAIVIDGRRQR